MLKLLSLLFAAVYGSLFALAFQNPIRASDGSDPFMVYDKGSYYLTTTTWSNIKITRASTIAGLKTATPKIIWSDTTASRCCNMWAPEIHWQPKEGAWFVYYSAGTSGNYDNQRIHVLRGSSASIGDSTWSYAGVITLPGRDQWFIDGSILIVGTTRYLVFSMFDGPDQCLFIAQMTSATTVGTASRISIPTLPWEIVTATVNEGPIALYHGGRTWIVYSASACWSDAYTLGRLELTRGANPLLESSWTKYPNAIFTSANGNNEPGHNAFFSSPSGNQTWNVYHASTSIPATCGGARYTNIQPVTWNSDGTPNLGVPRPLSENIPEPV